MTNRRNFIGLTAGGLAGAALLERADAASPGYEFTPVVPSLPIEGSAKRFAVHRIYCMGINYKTHAQESSFRAPGPARHSPTNPPA